MHRQTRKKLLNVATGVAVAAAAVVVFLPAAQAAPGTITTNVNVRSGPGTGYGVVDVATRGTAVDVQQCQGSWCYISKPGPDGWVSSNYINRSSGGTTATPVQPGVNFGINVPGGPSINFGVGNQQTAPIIRPTPPRPQPQPVYDEVCFFDQTRQRGASFCLEEGQGIRDLGNWADRISSIDNPGGYAVQICTETRYQGCRTYTTSASSLGDLNDYSASVRIQ
jgi:uncharacterized protein YraI